MARAHLVPIPGFRSKHILDVKIIFGRICFGRVDGLNLKVVFFFVVLLFVEAARKQQDILRWGLIP